MLGVQVTAAHDQLLQKLNRHWNLNLSKGRKQSVF